MYNAYESYFKEKHVIESHEQNRIKKERESENVGDGEKNRMGGGRRSERKR